MYIVYIEMQFYTIILFLCTKVAAIHVTQGSLDNKHYKMDEWLVLGPRLHFFMRKVLAGQDGRRCEKGQDAKHRKSGSNQKTNKEPTYLMIETICTHHASQK